MNTQAQALDYACEADPINLAEGDVLSSETLNDIVKRINNNIVGFISQSELNGTWSCQAILPASIGDGASNPGQGFAKDENGVWESTNTLVFEYETDETSKVIIENLWWNANSYVWPVNTCIARVIGPGIWMTDEDPDVIIENIAGNCQMFKHVWTYTKRSDTCFTIDGYSQGSVNVICNKQNVPPDAPLTLAVSVSQTSSQASLAWASGDSSTTGYDVQRKTSIDGAFSSIATTTEASYLDTITINNTYWYRIFATNANGTGRGSNVRKITFSNTPPSLNMASVYSINEGNTSITTITVSDIEAERITNPQTLTYSIASQAPGNDASDFTLANDGGLSFNATPDYESPVDYGTNNIYDITISVSDGYDTASQDVSVVVLNVSD